jgi:nucleotide-binding universal stress UspA family protein
MLENILVTLDGSELSEKAIPYTQQIAKSGAQITLLTVIDMPDISAYSLYPMAASMDYYTEALSQAEAGAVEYIEREAELLRKKGFQVDTIVSTGIAAETIVERAKSLAVDMIVMSTHGRSGFNQWLFGSVTHKVLSLAPCPVLVVPGRRGTDAPSTTATDVASAGND